jgi:hypothetical protein
MTVQRKEAREGNARNDTVRPPIEGERVALPRL